jgi:hypothetical protein
MNWRVIHSWWLTRDDTRGESIQVSNLTRGVNALKFVESDERGECTEIR